MTFQSFIWAVRLSTGS